MLHNADRGWGVSNFPEKSVAKVHGSTLLALRAGGWVSNIHEKCYITLEWPPYRECWGAIETTVTTYSLGLLLATINWLYQIMI